MERLATRKHRRDDALSAVQGRTGNLLKGLGIGLGAAAGLGGAVGLGVLRYGAWRAAQPYMLEVYQGHPRNGQSDIEISITEFFTELGELGKGLGDTVVWTRAGEDEIRELYERKFPDRKDDTMEIFLRRKMGLRKKIEKIPRFGGDMKQVVMVRFSKRTWAEGFLLSEEDEEGSSSEE